MTEVAGETVPGFEPVLDAFRQVAAEQRGTVAAMADWHDGRWVARLHGGYADAALTRPWASNSVVMPYSVTKPFAAVCLLILVDRGLVDLDEPMQTYWPEFTARATVRQVLSHQAGVVALDDLLPTAAFYNWDRMCAALAEQEPLWRPGERHGESALFYGHLVGEVVRRVDGRSLGTFLREEVCGPLGIDFQVRLTAADQARCAEPSGLTDEEFRRRVIGRRRQTPGSGVVDPGSRPSPVDAHGGGPAHDGGAPTG